MEVDAFMALMRLTCNDDKVVANLARMALNLAKGIRDAEARAELAEAALSEERNRIAGFMAAVENKMGVGNPAPSNAIPLFRISRERIALAVAQ